MNYFWQWRRIRFETAFFSIDASGAVADVLLAVAAVNYHIVGFSDINELFIFWHMITAEGAWVEFKSMILAAGVVLRLRSLKDRAYPTIVLH